MSLWIPGASPSNCLFRLWRQQNTRTLCVTSWYESILLLSHRKHLQSPAGCMFLFTWKKQTNLFFPFPTFPNAIWPRALEAMTFLKRHLNSRNKFLWQLSQGRHAESHARPPKSHLFRVFILAHKSWRQLLFFFFCARVVKLRKHYPAFTVDSETQMGTLLRCTNRIPEPTAPLHQWPNKLARGRLHGGV